jgi:hypothetical protein
MKSFHFSKWINSLGGPLVALEEKCVHMWNGVEGEPSDYDLSCLVSGYTGKIFTHGSEVLVLGDEPLQTCIATNIDSLFIVRWLWADSDEDVFKEIKKINLKSAQYIDSINITWKFKEIILFDAVDRCDINESVSFSVLSNKNKISTFLLNPNKRVSLLVHAIEPV